MIEIKKELFKRFDEEDEKKIVSILEDEKTCKQVAMIYSRYVYTYSGKKIWLLTSRMKESTKQRQLEKIRKLIRIAAKLGVSEEMYIRAQFEQQMVWLRKRGLNYVPFVNLISDKAVKWFEQYCERIRKSYGIQEADRRLQSIPSPRVYDAISDSIEKFYKRLEVLQKTVEITDEKAIEELECLYFAGMINGLYLLVCPLAQQSKDLTEKIEKIQNKTSKFDRVAAEKVWKEIKSHLENQDLARFV